MSKLKDPRREKFCQHFAVNNNGTAAAKHAGYATGSKHGASVQAARFKKDPTIQERIDEIRAEMTTDLDVVKELEKIFKTTRGKNDGTAIRALDILSKISGPQEEEEDISLEDIEKEIIDTYKVIGFDKSLKLLKKAFPEKLNDH